MPHITRIVEHIDTRAGSRFAQYTDDEDRRGQLIDYYNEVHAEDPEEHPETECPPLDDDTPLEEVEAMIEESENINSEELYIADAIDADERERDTILAALRLWQGVVEGKIYVSGSGFSGELLESLTDIANNGRTGDNAALSPNEIDALCERINT